LLAILFYLDDKLWNRFKLNTKWIKIIPLSIVVQLYVY